MTSWDGAVAEPWRRVRVGDIAKVIVSNVDKKCRRDELPVRLCNYTDVYKNDFIRPTMDLMRATATREELEKFHLEVGDVLITKDSEDPTDIAVPALVEETAPDLVCGYHLAIIRPGCDADGLFLKYSFDLPQTRAYFGSRAHGAIRFGLTVSSILSATMCVPRLAEQRAIAETLRTWDEGISRLQALQDARRREKRVVMRILFDSNRWPFTKMHSNDDDQEDVGPLATHGTQR